MQTYCRWFLLAFSPDVEVAPFNMGQLGNALRNILHFLRKHQSNSDIFQ
jgi:hypothetical protein